MKCKSACGPHDPGSFGHGGIDRRAVLKRISLGAAVAVGLPWIVAAARGAPLNVGGGCRYHVPTGPRGGLPCAEPRPPVNPRNGAHDYTIAGSDPLLGTQTVLNGLLGSVPVFGAALSSLLNFFWPASQPSQPTPADIWNDVKDKVKAMIDQSLTAAFDKFYADLQDKYISKLQASFDVYLERLQDYQKYLERPSADPTELADLKKRIREIVSQLFNEFPADLTQFSGIGGIPDWLSLPMYVQAANLQFALLNDAIRFGGEYGYSDTDIDDLFVARWNMALAKTAVPGAIPVLDPDHPDPAFYPRAFVEKTLAAGFKQFEREYEQNRSSLPISINAWEDPNNDKTAAMMASGAWTYAKAKYNRTSDYIRMVKDYLDIWDGLPDPSTPVGSAHGRVQLNRTLWYGPYGVADSHDVGSNPVYHVVHKHGYTYNYINTPVVMQPDNPAVPPPPQVARGQRLSFLRFEEYSFLYWLPGAQPYRMPTGHTLYFDGDAPRDTSSGLNLAIPAQNPIVEVNVSLCDFTTDPSHTYRTDNGDTAATVEGYGAPDGGRQTLGTLVGGVEFVMQDKSRHQVGAKAQWISQNPQYGTSLYANRSETIALPGHILADLHRTSTVYQWLGCAGAPDYPNGLRITGTLMFAFKLQDPSLKPTLGVLASLHLASPATLTAHDLAQVVHNWHRQGGHDVSADEMQDLTASIAARIADNDLAARRTARWGEQAAELA